MPLSITKNILQKGIEQSKCPARRSYSQDVLVLKNSLHDIIFKATKTADLDSMNSVFDLLVQEIEKSSVPNLISNFRETFKTVVLFFKHNLDIKNQQNEELLRRFLTIFRRYDAKLHADDMAHIRDLRRTYTVQGGKRAEILRVLDEQLKLPIIEEKVNGHIKKRNPLTEEQKKLVEDNMRLVSSIAKKYEKYADMNDLMQEGALGLSIAVQMYDPKISTLSTYATGWIKSYILKFIVKDRLITKSDATNYYMRKVSKARKELAEQLQREPTPEEIAGKINFSTERIKSYLQLGDSGNIKFVSLNRKIIPNGKKELMDLLAIDKKETVEKIERQDLKQVLHQQLEKVLSPTEQKVILMRYNGASLKEIAISLHVGIKRAQQIVQKALSKLQEDKETIKRLENFI